MLFFQSNAAKVTNGDSIQLSHLRREVLIIVEACRPDLLVRERRSQTKHVALLVLRKQHANISIQDLADWVMTAAEHAWRSDCHEDQCGLRSPLGQPINGSLMGASHAEDRKAHRKIRWVRRS